MTTDNQGIFNGCAFQMGAFDKFLKTMTNVGLLPSGISEYKVLKDKTETEGLESLLVQCKSAQTCEITTPFEYGFNKKDQTFYHVADCGHSANETELEDFKALLNRCYDDFLSLFDTKFQRRSGDEDRIKRVFLVQHRNSIVDTLLAGQDPTAEVSSHWDLAKPHIQPLQSGRARRLQRTG